MRYLSDPLPSIALSTVFTCDQHRRVLGILFGLHSQVYSSIGLTVASAMVALIPIVKKSYWLLAGLGALWALLLACSIHPTFQRQYEFLDPHPSLEKS